MDQNPKQQVSEKLRSSANVLVTVSKNPSVDQLASAIGLTLMLNKLGKHATAVFSGKIPDTMKFLEPEKTLDANVDSLRDFIISLDKEKADKLRYKVEDDVVRIYITPYKTTITQDDLNFSQGDFNVDAVVALGIEKQEDIDQAITSHGKILHDATVMTINTGDKDNKLGAIDWHEPTASSICEMLVSISEALQGNILDGQMSTAFLTGIVAATDRFSNEKTTPKVMTMSAQLMAAGANQQLIATNLGMKVNVSELKNEAKDDTELKIHEEKELPAPQLTIENGEIVSDHKTESSPKDLPVEPESKPDEQKSGSTAEKLQKDKPTNDPVLDKLEAELKQIENPQAKVAEPASDPEPIPDKIKTEDKSLDEIESEVHKLEEEVGAGVSDVKESPVTAHNEAPISEPALGGTFNATSEDAKKKTDQQRQDELKNETLTHSVEPIIWDSSWSDFWFKLF